MIMFSYPFPSFPLRKLVLAGKLNLITVILHWFRIYFPCRLHTLLDCPCLLQKPLIVKGIAGLLDWRNYLFTSDLL